MNVVAMWVLCGMGCGPGIGDAVWFICGRGLAPITKTLRFRSHTP